MQGGVQPGINRDAALLWLAVVGQRIRRQTLLQLGKFEAEGRSEIWFEWCDETPARDLAGAIPF